MKKLFYLSSCSTCKRLMNSWNLPSDLLLVDLKKEMFSAKDLSEMHRLAGSYEALFSKRSQTFVAQGLKETIEKDEDYGSLLPTDYTFLKRPVLVYGDAIFIGNSVKTDAEVKDFLSRLK